MKKLRDGVAKLKWEELIRANREFPLFRSDHEAVGVIEEEVGEAVEDFVDVINTFEDFKDAVFHDGEKDEKKASIERIEQYAVEAACECIQIASMARKWKMSSYGKVNDEEYFPQEHADMLVKQNLPNEPNEKKLVNFEIPDFLKSYVAIIEEDEKNE